MIWRFDKGLEIVEEEKGCGRVLECLRKERMVGAQEGYAVQWRA